MAQGRRRGFDIEYAKESLVDLMALAVRDRAIVRDQIEAQLRGEPLRETRNRKPTAPNSLGAWELRVQPYRVFYNVDEADRVV